MSNALPLPGSTVSGQDRCASHCPSRSQYECARAWAVMSCRHPGLNGFNRPKADGEIAAKRNVYEMAPRQEL